MTVPQTTAELMEEVSGLSSDQVAALRRRACDDLYFMSKGVLGFKDVNVRTHGAFIKFIQHEPKLRRLAMMPRFYLKTTIATEADSLRLGLSDPDYTRVLIVNEVEKNAKDILASIRGHCEKNPLLRFLFRDLIPERFTGPGVQWSSEGATLVRSTSWKEPTWMALGVGGAATSKHFSHIKADDLIGLEAKRSPAELKKAIDWNNNIEALVIDAYTTRIDWIGTRWAKNDLYGHIIEQYGESLARFRRKVIENGEITFPEKINWEFIARLQKTPDVFYAQFMNDPQNTEALDFDSRDLQTFRFGRNRAVVFESSQGERRQWEFELLDRVLTVDPNGGSKTAPDEAAIEVSGTAPDERIFVLEDYGGRPDPTEFVDKIFETACRWDVRCIGIEKAGQQNTRHYLEKKMRKARRFFHIQDLEHKNKEKEQRIREALQPIVSSRMLYLLPNQVELRKQFEDFPATKNDDRIDALAYGPQVWRTPLDGQSQAERKEAVKKVLDYRNARTGY